MTGPTQVTGDPFVAPAPGGPEPSGSSAPPAPRGGPAPSGPPVDADPGGPGARTLVVAVEARSRTERALVAEWAAEHHPGAAVVRDDEPVALARALGTEDELRVVPVRVSWLPDLRTDGGRLRPVHFVLLVNPRRPPAPLQPLLRGRTRITVGAPGLRTDLRSRFAREAGRHGPGEFARFVAHQASVACDVAERAVVGDRFKVPRQVAEQIAGSARFEERIRALAEELGEPVDEVREYGRSCLGELATVQSELGIDLYGAFMRPMHAKAWTVETDRAGFERVRELSKRHALVFLPTHRSYVDPMVMQTALSMHDMPPNHILGGANMAWWPLGPLGRRAGVVFIRRSFGKDKVYKLAIREFLGHLVAKRFNLEWYIEGGRTRTGKLRPPKLGLLRYLAEALEDDRAEDVMLVSVSIVYDRLREASATTAEQTGHTKQAEGLRWWAGYVRSQSKHVGKARVHIGETFLLREAMAEAGEGPAQLDKVAFRICDAINAVTPVTATSLVTLALLGARGVALSFAQIEALSAPLLDYVERRELRGPVAELRTTAGLRRGLESLVDAGVLERYDGGTEPVWSVAAGGHHVAAFYRNGALHHVVNRAIVELALLRTARAGERGEAGVGPDDVEAWSWREALALRDLLKFEFFFAPKPRFGRQLQDELAILDAGGLRRLREGDARGILEDAPTILANRALRSFLDAQLVVAERLAERDPRRELVRDRFLQECLDVGRQMLLQGRILQPEAVGRELFLAALRLAENRDLVDPGRDEVAERRRAWLAEVEDVIRDLEELRRMDETRQDQVLRDDHR
jgi:glycerol-3-phosphate O-acyltransferase